MKKKKAAVAMAGVKAKKRAIFCNTWKKRVHKFIVSIYKNNKIIQGKNV